MVPWNETVLVDDGEATSEMADGNQMVLVDKEVRRDQVHQEMSEPTEQTLNELNDTHPTNPPLRFRAFLCPARRRPDNHDDDDHTRTNEAASFLPSLLSSPPRPHRRFSLSPSLPPSPFPRRIQQKSLK